MANVEAATPEEGATRRRQALCPRSRMRARDRPFLAHPCRVVLSPLTTTGEREGERERVVGNRHTYFFQDFCLTFGIAKITFANQSVGFSHA